MTLQEKIEAGPETVPLVEDPAFTPIRVGNFDVKNRLVMSSVTSGLGDHTGAATERNAAFLERRARGGVGMVITEALHVHPASNIGYNHLAIHDDRFIAPLSKVAEAVQGHGACIIGQLIHVGRQWHSAYSRLAQVAPSPGTAFPVWLETAHELELEEIAEIVQAFGDAAERVGAAGLDGIEIHGAHGFLIQQFLSPLANQRSDAYGGSLENRMRFLLEIIDAVRARVGPDLIVGYKLSAEEMVPGGMTLDDTLEVVSHLESRGALDRLDYYQVSVGGFDSIESMHPTSASQVTPFIENAAAVKKISHVPVIAIGKIKQEAGAVIAEGKADMVAFARPLICDPDVPLKLREERMEEIRSCLSCNECHQRIWHNRTIGCTYNPEAGFETEPVPETAPQPKRVVIVGAGPAGCEAARVAALRGHRVTLLEREDSIGGRVMLAALLPGQEDLAAIPLYYAGQLDGLGVDVRLETEASPETVLQLDPEVVVFATGTRAVRPEIPGMELPHVFDMDTVVAGETDVSGNTVAVGDTVAAGNTMAALENGLGRHVVVYDEEYHLAGSGTAEMLAGQGHRITFITPYHAVGPEIEINTSHLMHRSHAISGIRTHTDTRIRSVTPGIVTAQNRYGTEPFAIEDVDAVVVCNPGMAENRLYRELKGRVPETLLVGDAFAPRRIMAAVRDAYARVRFI
ncbi:MAG: FAD-dependent oxidoreductase [bacterium]